MTRIGFLFALATIAGCVDEPTLGDGEQAVQTHNGRYLNGILYNSMTYNAMTFNALTFNGMDLGNGLDLDDPDVHMFVEYLVQCALPGDSAVTIHGESFAGALGLAPEWATAPCGESCQRWVSACLLARVNARGERVEISMRGPTDALHPGARELALFAVEDGTFFGNLFAAPQTVFAASPRADLSLPRSCGDDADCRIEILGNSADVCALSSVARGRAECPYDETVTVFLR